MSLSTFRLVCLLALAAGLLSAQGQRRLAVESARRVALVVGNNNYNWDKLTQAVPDAQAVSAMLPSLGFDPRNIYSGENLTLRQFQSLRRRFLDSLRAGDLAFVYYSGHGVEALGTNYLVPIDFPTDATESQAADEAISAQELLARMQDAGAVVRIMVLDACRNNPLRKVRSTGGGLGDMSRVTGRGTLVMFAAEAGKTATDSGVFRRRLLEQLRNPDVPADEAFKRVARAVDSDTNGKQTPALYGLLLEDFSFAGRAARVNAPLDLSADAWAAVKDTNNCAALRDFLNDYGTSPYASVARLRLRAVCETTPAPIRFPLSNSPQPGDFKVNAKDGQRYIYIPAGTFTMGCSPGDNDCYPDEKPAHNVTISRGFWIGQVEVTVNAWKNVYGKVPHWSSKWTIQGKDRDYNPNWSDGLQPVIGPSHPQAVGYCQAIGGRLPTDAEWEYAARAGTTASRYGNLEDIAWTGDNSGRERLNTRAMIPPDGKWDPYGARIRDNLNNPQRVGQKRPNAWGLYDMLGNVEEWVADWYDAKYFANSPERNPQGPPTGTKVVTRGGNWRNTVREARLSFRTDNDPNQSLNAVGFRCVMD